MKRTWKLTGWMIAAMSLAICSIAPAQTSQPSGDDAPVPALMAPTYIQVGKELGMRVRLFRENVAELTLDDKVRKQAFDLLDAMGHEIDALVSDLEAGRMPSSQRAMAVPGKLKAARRQLLEMVGPEQAKTLNDKIQSIRGQARYRLGQLQIMIDDLKLEGESKDRSTTVLKQAVQDACKLPDAPVSGDEDIKCRDAMDQLLGRAHDQLAALLSPGQQEQLGPNFKRLAMQTATTQP